MKDYRKWVVRAVAASGLLLISILLLNYIVDPLQHYRRATFYRPYYKSERYLNPGIARSHDYDTVIIGTSMVQNFRPSSVDAVLGGRSIKLPIAGSSAYEQNLTVGAALKTGKVRKVLLGLDIFACKGAPDRLSNGPGSMPLYLYDEDPFNDLSYLLSIDTLSFYKYLIRANLLGTDTRLLDHDNYGYWANRFHFSKESVLQSWQESSFNNQFVRDDFIFPTLKNNFDQNFLNLFSSNPAVSFEVFFPPYSILVWIDLHEKGVLEEALRFKRYVAESVATLENVRIFDFQSEKDIILDLDNYKDISHYSPEINDRMIQSIAAGRYHVDVHSMREGVDLLRDLTVSHGGIYLR